MGLVLQCIGCDEQLSGGWCTACRRIPRERWHGDECGPVPSDPVLGGAAAAVARRADRLGLVGGG